MSTYESAKMHEHIVAPDIIWETDVEATTFVGDEPGTLADFSFDVGQYLSPLIIKAMRMRGSVKSFTVEMPQ
jgi:hypothetical protein